MHNFNNLENFNFKPEQNKDILAGANDLATKILHSHAESLNRNSFKEEIKEVITGLNKKVFFKLEEDLLWDLAVKNILQRQASGNYTEGDRTKLDKINHLFVNNLKDEVVSQVKISGEDFYTVLSEKLQEAKRNHIDLDNEYIESHKDAWANEYYNNL